MPLSYSGPPLPKPSPTHLAVCFVQTVAAAALIGGLSLWFHQPFLFPALGASTFMVFWLPGVPASAPKNVIVSHGIGAAIGWSCARLFQIDFALNTLTHDGSWRNLAAAMLALGTTAVIAPALRVVHPPSCATTLIFSLGFLTRAEHIAAVAAACVILTMFAKLVHSSSHTQYPWWSSPRG